MGYVSKLRKEVKLAAFKILNKEKYECPVCNYYGPFFAAKDPSGLREHAYCANCNSLERHRLQKLVLNKLAEENDFSQMRMLHFAPEPFFKDYFKEAFKEYVSADICREDVDIKADLRNLPFKDAECDIVFASHVMEHIKEDLTAIAEIRRVLKPGGMAVLPVPLIAEETIEYPETNHLEWGHVRAPGYDYYDRYCNYFTHVERYSSSDFPIKYQTFVYEDRSNWPPKIAPLRKPMAGNRHIDIVPVCFA